MMKRILCKASMENCQNPHDSYGMICVGCNCCGELNKETMWKCRYDATVRRLQDNVMKITDDFFRTEIQQLNIVSSIVSECEELKQIIAHLDLEKGVGIINITDMPTEIPTESTTKSTTDTPTEKALKGGVMNEYYNCSPEPLWCEDCAHFGNTDMGGEGMCDVDNHDTWYACPICEKFVPKIKGGAE